MTYLEKGSGLYPSFKSGMVNGLKIVAVMSVIYIFNKQKVDDFFTAEICSCDKWELSDYRPVSKGFLEKKIYLRDSLLTKLEKSSLPENMQYKLLNKLSDTQSLISGCLKKGVKDVDKRYLLEAEKAQDSMFGKLQQFSGVYEDLEEKYLDQNRELGAKERHGMFDMNSLNEMNEYLSSISTTDSKETFDIFLSEMKCNIDSSNIMEVLEFIESRIKYTDDYDQEIDGRFYLSDFLKHPSRTISSKKGDCEDLNILLKKCLDELGYSNIYPVGLFGGLGGHLCLLVPSKYLNQDVNISNAIRFEDYILIDVQKPHIMTSSVMAKLQFCKRGWIYQNESIKQINLCEENYKVE